MARLIFGVFLGVVATNLFWIALTESPLAWVPLVVGAMFGLIYTLSWGAYHWNDGGR